MSPAPVRWKSRSDVMTTTLEDEAVVLDAQGDMYSFSGTAQVAWLALPGTVAELVSAITDAFEISPTQAQQDITGFVDELRTLNLIEPDDG